MSHLWDIWPSVLIDGLASEDRYGTFMGHMGRSTRHKPAKPATKWDINGTNGTSEPKHSQRIQRASTKTTQVNNARNRRKDKVLRPRERKANEGSAQVGTKLRPMRPMMRPMSPDKHPTSTPQVSEQVVTTLTLCRETKKSKRELLESAGQKADYIRQAGFAPIQQEQMVLSYIEKHGSIKRVDVMDLCHLPVVGTPRQ